MVSEKLNERRRLIIDIFGRTISAIGENKSKEEGHNETRKEKWPYPHPSTWEDSEVVHFMIAPNTSSQCDFFFDKKGFEKFMSWWNDDRLIITTEKGYLAAICLNKKTFFHIDSIEKERIEFAKLHNLPLSKVHVHHINQICNDNRIANLEVLSEDEHANRHGFNTWLEYQMDRTNKYGRSSGFKDYKDFERWKEKIHRLNQKLREQKEQTTL